MIKDLLRARARAGTTIFLTTHILALREIAGRIGIMRGACPLGGWTSWCGCGTSRGWRMCSCG